MPNHASMGGVPEYLKRKIDNVQPDLSNYYTKAEVDEKVEDIDLTDYYTKTEVDAKLENIDVTQYPQILEFKCTQTGVVYKGNQFVDRSRCSERDLVFSWELNTTKDVTVKLYVYTDTLDASVNVTLPSSTKTYTVHVPGGERIMVAKVEATSDLGTATDSIYIQWLDTNYIGFAPILEDYSTIISDYLTNTQADYTEVYSKYGLNIQKEFTYVEDEQYLYIAIPSRLIAIPNFNPFRINDDEVTMELVGTVEHSNLEYNIYKSNQHSLGLFVLSIIFPEEGD